MLLPMIFYVILIKSVIYNIFIHAYKYIACKMCIVLNMVHIFKKQVHIKMHLKTSRLYYNTISVNTNVIYHAHSSKTITASFSNID